MMLDHKLQRDLLQVQWLDFIHTRLGTEPWVYVYSDDRVNLVDSAFFFSALVPNKKSKKLLRYINWDLRPGDGAPGCSITYKNGQKMVKYLRFGNSDGIEPLVLHRSFRGRKQEYLEISEEFRLFHNLFYDQRNGKYIKIDQSGDEEDVIVFEENPTRVRVKLRPLKQFLAIKEMHLALFFSVTVYSDKTLEELGLNEMRNPVRKPYLVYDLVVARTPDAMLAKKYGKSVSHLLGKKLIPGMPKEESGYWPYEESKKYEDFIIGTDINGSPVLHTCNPDALANYFGINPGAPHYLTPVFFRREVLTKYYARPEKFTVRDGYIDCHGGWALRIDNDHEKYVVVFLGDLGRDLPYKEQVYWKSYNVEPEGTISETYFRRSFLSQWVEPKEPDLVLKHKFELFQEKWQKKFGWPLFKPLSEADQHNYKVLRVPLTNDQHEFDQQVLSLTKILIDSINEEELERRLPGAIENEKGISKLERFLGSLGLTDYMPHIKFLRDLYELRSSGVGHRKGKNWRKVAVRFNLGKRDLSEVFGDILRQATRLLEYLEKRTL